MTLNEFLDKHKACTVGRERAKAFTSLEDAWQNCSPEDLRWAATRPGVLTKKEIGLFVVFCARSVQQLMTDPRSRNAVEVAEWYVHGRATRKELRNATHDAADAAAHAAHDAYASDASVDAAYAAAHAADAVYDVYSAFAHVTSAYASSATLAAAAYAAYAAAAAHSDADIAREQQAAWLRQNTTPKFN